MSGLVDEAGNRYGRLTVIERAAQPGPGRVRWLCQCDCGTVKAIPAIHLRSGRTKSCSCDQFGHGSRRRHPEDDRVIDGEVWRAVEGASRYSISDHGRLRGWAGAIVQGYLDKNGYPMVYLKLDDGRGRTEFAHLVVAQTFLGPAPDGKECDHIDRNRANPKLTNLRYITHAENIENSANVVGEDHGMAKLTEAQVREILAILPGPRWGRRGKGHHPNSVISIAERYGISNVTVLQLRRGERWRHVFDDMVADHPHLVELAKKRRIEPPRRKLG